MFFQLKEKPILTKDTYDLVVELIKAALHFECPEHRANHHILYTANAQLDAYREAQTFYRPFENPISSLGSFSTEAYQLATKRYNQLYTLIRGYMHISDATRREHFNHHFRFHKEKIDSMYTLFEQLHLHKQLNLEQAFFEHLKEDLIPLLTQIE